MNTKDHPRAYNLRLFAETSPASTIEIEHINKTGLGLLHRHVSSETMASLTNYLRFDRERMQPKRISPEVLFDAREYGAVPLVYDMVLFDCGAGRLFQEVLEPREDLFVHRKETALSHREDGAEHWHGVATAAAFLIRCRDLGLDVDVEPLVAIAKERLPDTRFMTMDEATVDAWPKRQGGQHPWTLTARGGGIAVRSETFTTATGHAVTAKIGSDGAMLAMTFVPPPAAAVRIGEPQPRRGMSERKGRAVPQVAEALRPIHEKRKARTIARNRERENGRASA